MSVFHDNALIGSGAGTGAVAVPTGYVIPKSLRFDEGDAANLKKTPSTAGNRVTWTWSAWVKRTKSSVGSTYQTIFSAGADGNNNSAIVFDNSDRLEIWNVVGNANVTQKITSRVFRDFSSWYHFVVAADSSTLRLYVNGEEVTSWATDNEPGGENWSFSGANAHYLGHYWDGGSNFKGDFLLADVQFVDGAALAPTAFGETRSSDGVWVPKEYTGNYNVSDPSFGLSSSDIVSTTGFQSGEGADKVIDSTDPTANRAHTVAGNAGETITVTFSPAVTVNTSLEIYAYLTVSGDSEERRARVNSGDWFNPTSTADTYHDLGFTGSLSTIQIQYNGSTNSRSMTMRGIRIDGTFVHTGGTAGVNGFHLNFSDSSTNEALGFDSAPTIPDLDPKKGFDVVTYTGNGASTPGGSGSTQNVGGLAFEPGLLWIKDRTQSGHNHNLIDVINQPPNLLMSDSTAALTTNSTDGVTSFNPDGFALGANSSGSQSLEMNKSGNNYVAWAWKAGGRAVSNTNGSITSQVSASPDYGFSVVKWTGTAATATVGHGLSSAPKWILVKFTGSTSQWSVYHESVGNTKRLLLNSSNVAATGSTYWNDTSPTSTLFTVGGDLNDSTEITAYCWSEVSGFSKFGSWTGTGSAGLTVTTGFKPRFLMWKRTDNAQNWAMVDSERSGSNPMDDWLGPAYSDNESSNNSAYSVDFLDDGFSINATHAATNASGGTYVYMCFADRPGNNWDVNNIVTNEGLTTSKTQFDVVTYTGNGGSSRSIDSLAFQPDLVYIKARSAAYSGHLYDSVRGVTKRLRSDQTAVEGTKSGVTAFNSDGFTLGSDLNSNENNTTYVAWCWKAGGTAVSNTDGSITSSVSANAAYGFSIVSFTANGTNGATVGHGLSSAPQLVILKQRDRTANWFVNSPVGTGDGYLMLNSTDAADNSNSTVWNSTAPSSTVVTLGNSADVNNSGTSTVMYCFANVPGYQRIGSYTGNGSSTGPVIVTGFKPRFLIIKRTDAGPSNWYLLDTERDSSNPVNALLRPNLSDAEVSAVPVDMLQSGFQLKDTDAGSNASGGTYIYLAIGDDEIGSDEDCLVDVPNAVTADADATDTTGGYQRGNYCTWNPLALQPSGHGGLQDGNLEIIADTAGSHKATLATFALPSTGKWYWEVKAYRTGAANNGGGAVGVAEASAVASTAASGTRLGETNSSSWVLGLTSFDALHANTADYSDYLNGGTVETDTGIIGIAVDMDNDKMWMHYNGVYGNAGGTGDPVGGANPMFSGEFSGLTIFPAAGVSVDSGSGYIQANFGQMRFKYPMPTGFSSLNTTALPAATIPDGSAHFEARTYTANATARSLTGYEFGPDWLWFKPRNVQGSHNLYDTVRGATKGVRSHANDAEYTDAQTVTSFNSDGFSLGTDSNGYQVNYSNNSMVVWAWNGGANSDKTYTVKVVSDSGNKYRFDDFGTSAVTLDLAEGSTYVFDQSDSSNSGHPLRFSTTSDGTHNSGTEYTTGVTTTGTPGSAGAKTTIVVGSGVATLYYYCSSHSGMGGQANTNSTAGASNFDGSVQSTVKANPEAGFSIVSYTATGSNLTVGHGLNATPAVIITKDRSAAKDWLVMHESIDVDRFLKLNETQAKAGPYTNVFTSVSTTTFGTGNDAGINTNGNNRIAYCMSAVSGYSAFGSYEANGSADGPFVLTSFRPALVICKSADQAQPWQIFDSAREPSNVITKGLQANSTGAEYDTTARLDFLSNGFKIRAGGGSEPNVSGNTYIYLAWAENPFSSNGGLAR